MPLTFPDNPQIGQTIEYSFTHPNLGGETGDEVTRLWTWNGPTMGWVSNGTRQLDYITRTEAIDIFVNESGDTMTGTLTGTDIYLSGSLTTDKGFRESGDPEFQNNEFITKQYGEDIYVNESGDTMTGTLTGTDISLTGSLSAAGPIFVSKGFRRSVDPEFQDNEFITKLYGEDNFGSGDMQIIENSDAIVNSTTLEPKRFRTLRQFKMRDNSGNLITYQLDDTFIDFDIADWPDTWQFANNYPNNPPFHGIYIDKFLLVQNLNQIPNYGWARMTSNIFRVPTIQLFSYGIFLNYACAFRKDSNPRRVDYGMTQRVYSGAYQSFAYNLKGVAFHIQVMTYSDPQ